MNVCKSFSRCGVILLFCIAILNLNLSTIFTQSADPSKLDVVLRLIYNRYDSQWRYYAAKDLPIIDPSVEALRQIVVIDLSGREPVVPVAAIVRDQGQEMKAKGFQLQTQIGDVVTTRVPISRLPSVASLASVLYVQASTVHRALVHDVSVPETKATLARQSFGLTGRGVIVGIIDTGIDWRHDDFRRPDGRTRIKFMWDMFDKGGPGPADIPGASGTVYTEEQINAALAGTGTVREADRDGHGTHVAGSAAGNGRATGGRFPAGTFTGMAPEADLIVVKYLGDDGRAGDGKIEDALKFIDNRARQLNMPYVVNMSLGSHLGAHDGTDADELAIDSLVGPGKPGKVICIAAGNEGSDDIHASGTVPAGAAETVRFTVPADQPIAVVDIWYSGGDSFDIVVTTPTNLSTDRVSPGGQFSGTAPDGTRVEVGSSGLIVVNNSKRILIIISQTRQGQPILQGTWSFQLRRTIGDSGRFDAWIAVGRSRFADHIDPSRRVGMPGTAKNAITVGSYITKLNWTDIDGTARSFRTVAPTRDAPLSSKSPFSSPGPTRDGRLKPEIAAPGQGIGSANSTDSEQVRPLILPDGKHKILWGTSMATPHVTGAVALILQANPNLDASQVRDLLTKTARSDDFTGRVPNPNFGFGKMDVFEAIKLIRGGPAGPAPTPDPVITTVAPDSIQRGTTVQVAISGSNFSGARLTVEITPSAGITVNQAAAASANRVNLSLTVATGAAVGNYQVVVIVDGRRSNPGIFKVVSADVPPLDPEDPFEPNDDLEKAKPIPIDGRITAKIDPKADIDVFKFPATRGRKVTFDIDARTLSPASELDSIIGVFDRFGNLLDFNDDDGETLDSHLEWTPSVTDTYFIAVAAFPEGESGPTTTGRYLLKVDGHSGDVRDDRTPPILDPRDIFVPQVLNRTNELFAVWFAEDPESGIERYEYAVGTNPGASNVVPFTRTTNNSVYLAGLSLQNGATYYFTIKAVNGAGLSSEIRYSQGIRIDTSARMFPIYFPRVVAFPGSLTGVAVTNPTSSPVQVIFRLFDNKGNLVLGDGITNPIALTFNPREQLPILSTQLFGVRTSNTPGWIEVQATNPEVKAFFLYGAFDLSFFDGADVSGNLMTDFTFHRVQEAGENVFTVVSIVNPNDGDANATAELRDRDGRLVSSQNITIGAKQRLVKLVRDLFPGVTQQVGGTIRVRSNVGLTGFELFASEAEDIGGINPQATNDTTRSLFFAQLATQGDWFTEISLTNPNDAPVEVELRALNDSGSLITGPGVMNPVSVRIPARGQFNGTAKDTFRFTGSQLIVGYISAQVTSGGGIFGHVVFGTTNRKALAALPVQTQGARNVVFSQVAQGGRLFTGLTLLNTDASPASVRIEVLDSDGRSIGSRLETFQPREKKARIINQIIPEVVDQLDGYIRIASDRPLVGFELFGDLDLSFLAAVPPQPLSSAQLKGYLELTSNRKPMLKGREVAGSDDESLYMKLYRGIRGGQAAEELRRGWAR